MSFCPNCGTPATPDTRFCQRCGATISAAPTPTPPPPRQPSYGPPQAPPPPPQQGGYYPQQPPPPQQGGYYQPQAPQYPQPAYPAPVGAKSQNATWMGGGILAVGAIIAILLYTGVISFTSGPKKAVEEARAAYNRKDVQTFDKYVDLQSVIGDYFDQMGRAGQMDQATLMQVKMSLPQITDVVKSVFFGTPTNAPPQMVQAITASSGQLQEALKRVTYQGVQDEQKTGSDATINVKLADNTAPQAKPGLLLLKLKDVGSNWKIVAAPNLSQMK